VVEEAVAGEAAAVEVEEAAAVEVEAVLAPSKPPRCSG